MQSLSLPLSLFLSGLSFYLSLYLRFYLSLLITTIFLRHVASRLVTCTRKFSDSNPTERKKKFLFLLKKFNKFESK